MNIASGHFALRKEKQARKTMAKVYFELASM
jgi:hypothetical protein